MSAEEIADIVDYRYLTDVLTRDEALAILKKPRVAKGAYRDAEGRGICVLYDVGGLARLRRCQAAPSLPGGNRCRLQPRQDEGWP